MKNLFFVGRSYALYKKVSLIIITAFTILYSTVYSQTSYYSNFTNPAGKVSTSEPTGTLCLAPGFANSDDIADANLNGTPASVSGLLSVALLCNGNTYSIKTKLNFGATGVTAAPAGYYAGFRVRFNTLIALSVLQNNITIRTYLNGNLRQTQPGASLLGLNLLAVSNTAQDVYFQTNLTFDEVEIILNTSIIALTVPFNYQFFFGFASPTTVILPVKLTSFTAIKVGKYVRLQWATATEVNTAKYDVERSNDGGRTFSTIGSVAAKGNSANTTDYSFTDGAVVNGDYLYRLKIIDKDGAFEYSKSVSIKGLSAASWKVYPTMLSKGANIIVDIATNSSTKTEVRLSNLQGQTVRTLKASSSRLLIATNDLPAGIYSVKLFQNGQLTGTEKVVIQ